MPLNEEGSDLIARREHSGRGRPHGHHVTQSISVASVHPDYPANHLSVISQHFEISEPCTLTLRSYPKWILFAAAVACVVTGVFGSIVFKWQNKIDVKVCATCPYTKFEGALYQTQMMFFAEVIALPIYYADKYFSARANKARLFDFAVDKRYYETKEGPFWIWPFYSLLDCSATLMIMIALKMTYASTVQMLRNVMIVEVLLLQPLILKKAARVHEVIGVIIVTGAMVLTAIPAITIPDTSTNTTQSDTILGCVLALAGTTIQSVQLLLEELSVRKGRSAPLRSVGWEGAGGIVWSMLAWPVCQKLGLESITDSWWASLHNLTITLITLSYLPLALIFNFSGLTTTMLGSGMLRGVCFAVRSPLVWVISLVLKWQKYDHWSLASAIIFCVGFAVYINILGFKHGSGIHMCLSKPIHCCHCITNPDLDEPYDWPDDNASSDSNETLEVIG